jgi:hypothetical protein
MIDIWGEGYINTGGKSPLISGVRQAYNYNLDTQAVSNGPYTLCNIPNRIPTGVWSGPTVSVSQYVNIGAFTFATLKGAPAIPEVVSETYRVLNAAGVFIVFSPSNTDIMYIGAVFGVPSLSNANITANLLSPYALYINQITMPSIYMWQKTARQSWSSTVCSNSQVRLYSAQYLAYGGNWIVCDQTVAPPMASNQNSLNIYPKFCINNGIIGEFGYFEFTDLSCSIQVYSLQNTNYYRWNNPFKGDCIGSIQKRQYIVTAQYSWQTVN